MRGLAVATVGGGTDTDLTGVDGTRDAVVGLDIQLGKGVLYIEHTVKNPAVPKRSGIPS